MLTKPIFAKQVSLRATNSVRSGVNINGLGWADNIETYVKDILDETDKGLGLDTQAKNSISPFFFFFCQKNEGGAKEWILQRSVDL